MRGAFISGTGTGVGKTFVTRALARSLSQQGERIAALKPVETGFTQLVGSDAQALAEACDRPELASHPDFFRASLPLAPRSVALEGLPPCPPLSTLVGAVQAAAAGSDLTLVEGAGGLLVPLDARHTILDFVHALSLPLLLVAPDQLGVLSNVLMSFDVAERRGVRVLGVVLTAHAAPETDPSTRTNRRALLERLPVPVLSFPRLADDLDLLAQAAARIGLSHLVRSVRSRV